ncbi:hypothetical protein Xish_03621 [Xenorhabdus ishibashii]|uniref:Uncharacterized protein n=1 Tax=Xenorhabdus ishibashii TaxID=1034471 RepID=A0A2D0K7Z8_9GAMM|nr:hypothetical protein Xish_03621 [Xenorhabdus ishibashii]
MEINYFTHCDTCDLLTEKFKQFSWNRTLSELKKEVMDLVKSFENDKYTILTLHILNALVVHSLNLRNF